jgi:hypothetical protein
MNFQCTDQGSQRPDQTVSLSDTEDLMRDGDLTEVKDEALCHEMSLADRWKFEPMFKAVERKFFLQSFATTSQSA